MNKSPEEIRADIERSRIELGEDVDALADKVTPSKIMHRQTSKVKSAVGSAKDRVFGVVDDVQSSVSEKGAQASGAVSDVKDRAIQKAEGNPIAVGLIAFGVGMLVSSLIPASTKEKEVADDLKDRAQPLIDEVTDVAKEVGGHLQEPARDAATAVKDAAADAMDHVKSDATAATTEVKDQVQQSRDQLKEN